MHRKNSRTMNIFSQEREMGFQRAKVLWWGLGQSPILHKEIVMGDGTIQGQGANIGGVQPGYSETSVTFTAKTQVTYIQTDSIEQAKNTQNTSGTDAAKNKNSNVYQTEVDPKNPQLASPGSTQMRVTVQVTAHTQGADAASEGAQGTSGGYNPYFSDSSALIAAVLTSVMQEITKLLNESTEVSTRQNIELTNASIDATKSAAEHTVEKGREQMEQAYIQGASQILSGATQIGVGGVGGGLAVGAGASHGTHSVIGAFSGGISKTIEGAGGMLTASYSLDIAKEDAAAQMQNMRADLYKQGARGVQDGQQNMVQALQSMVDALAQAARGTISPFKQV
jgi:hypothetical protein